MNKLWKFISSRKSNGIVSNKKMMHFQNRTIVLISKNGILVIIFFFSVCYKECNIQLFRVKRFHFFSSNFTVLYLYYKQLKVFLKFELYQETFKDTININDQYISKFVFISLRELQK